MEHKVRIADLPDELQTSRNEEITRKLLEEAARLQTPDGKRLTRQSSAATHRSRSGSVLSSIAFNSTSIVPETASTTASTESKPLRGPIRRKGKQKIKQESPDMNQRRAQGRAGARGGQENVEERVIWKEIQEALALIDNYQKEAAELTDKIFAEETRLADRRNAGHEPSPAELAAHDTNFRRQVRIVDEIKSIYEGGDGGPGLAVNLEVYKALRKHNEEKADLAMPRGSTSRDSRDSQSRSTVDMDGPSDSPGPPTAAERHARKLGAGRTSSQPPRNIEVQIPSQLPSESGDRASNRPKIVYAVDDEVAFKRKSNEDTDWIQGIVTRVIGEGKSRRYEVRDPFPDDKAVDQNNIYKSSASQMVPIPTVGTVFEDYEVGKRVLALYPTTSTFYRADVKRMTEGGKKVEVLFEEEHEAKEVERRMVLNHTG
ncbi:SAGA-associated factor, partial [Lachnellula suecica]